MWRFEYVEPKTLKELLSFLDRHGKKSVLLAGGTDIVPKLIKRTARPLYVVNVKGISGLSKLRYSEGGGLRIGALVTVREVESSAVVDGHYRVLARAAHTIGSVQTRNVATIVGNVCNAAPSADMVPPLLVLGAKAKVVSSGGTRLVPLDEFYLGPWKTVLKSNEFVSEVQVPRVPGRSGCVYMKHTIRKAMDMALVGVAVKLVLGEGDGVCKEARIALGATAPTPMRAVRAEGVLKGMVVDEGLLEEAGKVASKEAKPRSYPEYKREMVAEFTLRAGRQALEIARSS